MGDLVGGFLEAANYQYIKNIGSGNFGICRLCKNLETGAIEAIKYIPRGDKIDENVEREIVIHHSLRHPNIVGFKKVVLTPTHLAIVLEYAAGGELFDRISVAGRFSELEARYFFQQLISGVSYIHKKGICHRDLKLENTLLDGSEAPRVKICDFGYSKSSLLHSQPKSTVGTPAYIAPEVLKQKEYDGPPADMWSCGVTLFVMLFGKYPFEDPSDPRNFRKTIELILGCRWQPPADIPVTPECLDLLQRILVAEASDRITMADIQTHPWFVINLPAKSEDPKDASTQSLEELHRIVQEAKRSCKDHNARSSAVDQDHFLDDGDDDMYTSGDYLDLNGSGDYDMK
mmetsp:Transcript_18951/g.22683  ORF Transcript_18951/g.22683 Transcript_18951/m.22683 type:complete len:345 (+) Transcript_18951:268-1302(+)|eukprot:CAMPEP_0197852452 /NCGR_PEP_ID=MMETSP1438-20131217/20635_1 /TAXON_ID=1461541 /ORGANISM="Pterosperma sp., Strain CCMP1384" /LENGTH=344 /DNA_ID=CAMNT_0043466519 /DNA_START=268 /DNA_END=1302 /DNA_ORIENTATION=+